MYARDKLKQLTGTEKREDILMYLSLQKHILIFSKRHLVQKIINIMQMMSISIGYWEKHKKYQVKERTT